MQFKVKIKNCRISLPKELRAMFKMCDGETITIKVNGSAVELLPESVALEQARNIAKENIEDWGRFSTSDFLAKRDNSLSL